MHNNNLYLLAFHISTFSKFTYCLKCTDMSILSHPFTSTQKTYLTFHRCNLFQTINLENVAIAILEKIIIHHSRTGKQLDGGLFQRNVPLGMRAQKARNSRTERANWNACCARRIADRSAGHTTQRNGWCARQNIPTLPNKAL